MEPTLGIFAIGEHSAASLAAHSYCALDRPLRIGAELWVAVATDHATIVGAFVRATGFPEGTRLARRGSGGPSVHVGPGTIHVALSMTRPGVLYGSDSRRIVNRSVRPLLRALTRFTSGAYYFGRDWVAAAHRPAAWVGFGHDASTGRTLFEAFVAVSVPIAPGPMASSRGRLPTTLEAIAGHELDPISVAQAIVESYAHGTNTVPLEAVSESSVLACPVPAPMIELPWTATRDEAIGVLGAGPDSSGKFRVGGDLLASRDAIRRLETRAGLSDSEDGIARAVDEELGAPGVVVDGVRNLACIADVIARARGFDSQPNRSRSFPMNDRR